VTLQSLRVDRMPGIPRGKGFEIAHFSAQLTIIHGPNGVGKSSTARAIEHLLWPTLPESSPAPRALSRVAAGAAAGAAAVPLHAGGMALWATWLIDGSSWSVEREGRHVEWRREGRLASAPEFGPAELRHRYRLALAELLAATETGEVFAAVAQRALAGGFDLARIRQELLQDGKTPGRSTAARQLRQALDELGQAQSRDRALELQRAQQLPELERRLESARRNAASAEAVRAALRRLDAEEACRQADALLASLPTAALAACRAEDEETVEGLQSRMERSDEAVRVEESRLAHSSQRLQGRLLDVPAGEHPAGADSPEDLVSILLEQAQRLDELLRTHQALGVELAGELERRDESLRVLAAPGQHSPTPESVAEALAGLREDLDATRLARDGHGLRARRTSIESTRALLGRRHDAEQVAERAESLRQARRDLADWLAAAPARSSERLPLTTFVALGIAAVLCFSLAVFHSLWWLLALLVLLAVAAASTRFATDPQREERRAMQERIGRAGIRPPEAWTVDAVARRLRELDGEAAEGALAEARLAAHRRLDEETRLVSEAEAQHRQSMKLLETRFGTLLPSDEAWLPGLAASLAEWQRSHREAKQIRAKRLEIEEQCLELMRGSMARVAPLRLGEIPLQRPGEPANPEHSASHAMRRIARELEKLIECSRAAQRSAETLRDQLRPAALEARTEFDRFFAARSLAPSDRTGLRTLLADLDRFQRAGAELRQARAILAQEPPAGADQQLPATRQELEALRVRCHAATEELAALSAEVGALRNELQRAAECVPVGDALLRVAETRQLLGRVRDGERRLAAAEVLLRYLEREALERSQPEVLKRARELLSRLTHGRFELRLDDSPERQGFCVHDTAISASKSLAALSCGERVQLLCAVRLAFLDHEERRAIPLLVDEALGTSDDLRAAALMDALIDAARAGRQVICFTAQVDEARRWQSRLAGIDDIRAAFIDLGALRQEASAALAPLPAAAASAEALPAPGQLDHASYGALLRVAALTPFTQRPEQVHLWHAISDPHLLHQLLAAGFTTIGQVQRYRAATGAPPPGASERLCERVDAANSGLELLFARWRSGRAPTITFEDLAETGAVSESFAERVRELLRRQGGDPQRLLEALEQGELLRWQSAKTAELRRALGERGLLPIGPRLDEEFLAEELRIHLHEPLARGILELAWPTQVIRRLAEGSATGTSRP
jgi:hypothetical protein